MLGQIWLSLPIGPAHINAIDCGPVNITFCAATATAAATSGRVGQTAVTGAATYTCCKPHMVVLLLAAVLLLSMVVIVATTHLISTL